MRQNFVLIVEDDPDSRELLRQLLERKGYDTAIAFDGRQGMAILKNYPEIQIVLLDWMMPGLSGLEVIQRIRAEIKDRYVYVIMVTALSSRDQIKQAIDAGADDYIIKPFSSEEILSRVISGTTFASIKNEITDRLKEIDKSINVLHNTLQPEDFAVAMEDDGGTNEKSG